MKMKIIKLIALGVLIFISNTANAQISVNVNLGTPPSWGPQGYSQVDYYYLPDVEAYYDIRKTQFIYLNGGNWIRSKNLPSRYRNYDLYNGYKVVLNDYHGGTPYTYYKSHKVKYFKGYKGKPQKSIGIKSNSRVTYKNHDDHGKKDSKNDKDHGKEKGKKDK